MENTLNVVRMPTKEEKEKNGHQLWNGRVREAFLYAIADTFQIRTKEEAEKALDSLENKVYEQFMMLGIKEFTSFVKTLVGRI